MPLSYPPVFVACMENVDVTTEGKLLIIYGSASNKDEVKMPTMVRIQNIVNSVNLFIQILCIILVLHKCSKNKGPFYTMILIFSIVVSIRIIMNTAMLFLIANSDIETAADRAARLYSLHTDYFSNLFSLTITFFLSLNRCLCFLVDDWNSRIFEGYRVFLIVAFSALISILGEIGIIVSSSISRNFYRRFGVVDVSGDETGYMVSINRFFNLFPIGSIVCYAILYWYFFKKIKKSSSRSIFLKRGEQKAFSQLLVTSFLYIIMNSMYEFILHFASILGLQYDVLFWMKALALANYAPEMSLSLLFILDTAHFEKIFGNRMLPKRNEQERITVVRSTHV